MQRSVAVAALIVALGLTACETGHQVTITNRCATPIWVPYGQPPTETPTEVSPGDTHRFVAINDDRLLISATKDHVGAVVPSAGSDVVLSGSQCPTSQ